MSIPYKKAFRPVFTFKRASESRKDVRQDNIMDFTKPKELAFKNRLYVFFRKYAHSAVLLYLVIYLPWFGWLESSVTSRFHIIHMAADDVIPFVEYFIVPYLLWFLYVAAAVAYFFFKNKMEYYRLCTFLFTGMTVFLIVSTVYPNGHCLRPDEFARDNIFTDLVRMVYHADTPTNLFPSIHVYNSIGVNAAVWHCENFRQKKFLRYGSLAAMISIILSTVFLKQHSVFDVITGIVFAAFMYTLVYSKAAVRIGAAKTSFENRVRRV